MRWRSQPRPLLAGLGLQEDPGLQGGLGLGLQGGLGLGLGQRRASRASEAQVLVLVLVLRLLLGHRTQGRKVTTAALCRATLCPRPCLPVGAAGGGRGAPRGMTPPRGTPPQPRGLLHPLTLTLLPPPPPLLLPLPLRHRAVIAPRQTAGPDPLPRWPIGGPRRTWIPCGGCWGRPDLWV